MTWVLYGYTCCHLNIHIRKKFHFVKISFFELIYKLCTTRVIFILYDVTLLNRACLDNSPLHSCFSHQCDGKNVIYPCELMNGPRMSQIKHHFSFQVFPRDFSYINELCSSWKIHEKDLTWPSRFTYLISFMCCVTCKIPFSQRWKCLW